LPPAVCAEWPSIYGAQAGLYVAAQHPSARTAQPYQLAAARQRRGFGQQSAGRPFKRVLPNNARPGLFFLENHSKNPFAGCGRFTARAVVSRQQLFILLFPLSLSSFGLGYSAVADSASAAFSSS
jgi:hypothetical protein